MRRGKEISPLQGRTKKEITVNLCLGFICCKEDVAFHVFNVFFYISIHLLLVYMCLISRTYICRYINLELI